MREREARHAIGERRLADAGLAADQPGVRDSAAAVGLEQRPLGLRVAEQNMRVARMRNVVFVLARAIRRAHVAASSIISGASAGCSRALTTAQMASATASGCGKASISAQRAGSRAASST